jgi:hypothetical protein
MFVLSLHKFNTAAAFLLCSAQNDYITVSGTIENADVVKLIMSTGINYYS